MWIRSSRPFCHSATNKVTTMFSILTAPILILFLDGIFHHVKKSKYVSFAFLQQKPITTVKVVPPPVLKVLRESQFPTSMFSIDTKVLQSSSTSLSASSSFSNSNNNSNGNGKKKQWFARTPTDALLTQYDEIVRGAYVRHVVLLSEEMADLAMKTYLGGGAAAAAADLRITSTSSSANNEINTSLTAATTTTTTRTTKLDVMDMDPFDSLARDLSACSQSREEGGKIGWIDNPFFNDHNDNTDDKIQSYDSNEALKDMISHQVIQELFQNRPKGGDTFKIESKTDNHNQKNSNSNKYHLIRVDDILVNYIPNSKRMDVRTKTNNENVDMIDNNDFKFKQQGFNKVFTSRSKLKGLGTTPVAPLINSSQNSSPSTTKTTAQSYHIATTGCQMNVADSERLSGVLENDLELNPSNDPTKADIIILNTCSIRDHAEQKVYDMLGPHAARKRKGEPIAIVVAGCVAQQEGQKLLRRIPEIDLVMGPQYVNRLGDLLHDVSNGHQVVATDPTLLSEDLSRPVRGHTIRAWVNVIHGCNEHCTYCVVPGVRGVEQSRSMESILHECIELAHAGYKEITLLGQNIDAYGRDMTPKRNFADLLHYLNERIPPNTIQRIRYVTSHPRYFSDRVIHAVATLDKVCECFHMPFQSGDDDILKQMRRGYTFESYMKIIHKIRQQSPDASICGDVIVGFPGETEQAFQRTLDLMEAVKFDNLNTFAYSPRPNTEAALMENQIPEHIKAERLQKLQRLAAQHGMERSQRYVGHTYQVLVEDRNPRNTSQVMGRTRQNRQVFFDGNIDQLQGKLVNVKIIEAGSWSLVGILEDS